MAAGDTTVGNGPCSWGPPQQRWSPPARALAQTAQELEATSPNPNDWLSYHGTYKGYDYSGLDQINADNVKDLQVAGIHFPGKTIRGIELMPLAKDGV